VTALRGAMDRNHPTERAHDYLYFLGVRPEAQGLGVGSRLLKAHLAGLDAAGRPAFLETGAPRTLPLYRGHGFEVIGEYKARPDAPTMWALWREPRAV
jgi:ribosomal protein S18 acetylase RimI-like enzyme